MFQEGKIHDVVIRDIKKFVDERGWLAEVFREDEVERRFIPAMSYISVTHPGIARGPHEHVDQADMFAFIGPSNFKVYLWDNRKNSPTFQRKFVFIAGEDAPKSVVIPPGVVHAYKNVGTIEGTVINLPNKLFAGKGKKEPVDEIRHENRPDTLFQLD
ncbi:MAG: dTDP-4-dehydrorhamnose 3,5-epimerase family protein [Bacteroidota bacterium]